MTAPLHLRLWRLIRLLGHLRLGLRTLRQRFPVLDEAERERLTREWSARLLAILGIDLHVDGGLPGGGCLVVANHVSWLDIFLLNAASPVRFVSKAEVRDWPLVGGLVVESGTLFMERLRPSAMVRINREIGNILAVGGRVGVFPEGTTSWGDQVMHFHGALLEPAVKSGAAIVPVALRYRDEQGNPCREAAYADRLSFVVSLWRIVSCRQIRAELFLLPALTLAGGSRRELAQVAENAIRMRLFSPNQAGPLG